jgi:hypothetical protein
MAHLTECRPLAAAATPSALDDPHLIDTLFIVEDKCSLGRRLPPGRRFAVRFGRCPVVLSP